MDSAVLADNAVDALGIDFDVLAEMFGGLVVEAGSAVMAVYAQGCSARLKSDASPVCAADERAEAIILDRLALRLPHIPVVAEEKASHGDVPVCGRAFILVDPLDGTKEFLNRNGEFTVNIALILDGTPRAGAVYAPALGRLWFGGNAAFSCAVAPGAALPARALWARVHARRAPGEGLTAVASRSHADAQTEAFLATLSVRERRTSGSSVKFCTVAEGCGRCLSPVWPDDGVGHGRRRCRAARCRRVCIGRERRLLALWQGGRALSQRRFHRLGRSVGPPSLTRRSGSLNHAVAASALNTRARIAP